MFISATEASKMTWEERHITNFGIFCKKVNDERLHIMWEVNHD